MCCTLEGMTTQLIMLLYCNFLFHETLTGKIRNVLAFPQPITKWCSLNRKALSNSVDIRVQLCAYTYLGVHLYVVYSVHCIVLSMLNIIEYPANVQVIHRCDLQWTASYTLNKLP